jgi:hypothetical protein
MRFVSPQIDNYALTLARANFIKRGDWHEYIKLRAELDKPSQFTRWTPIEKGVLYKCDSRIYGEGAEQVQDLEVVGFRHIACLDWDWPNEGHKAKACVTIETFDDVLNVLHKQDDTWRVYITPGGVRAWCVSRAYHPSVMPKLGADPLYIDMCKRAESYWARVAPKIERSYDWVAEYVTTVGKDVKPEFLDPVVYYHDKVIEHIRGSLTHEQSAMIKALL